MNLMKKQWLKSRWIGGPPLEAGELLRQSSQIKQGLVMGMRLAVLEEQAAAVVVEGKLESVFLSGAYQLEKDKMPPLKPDDKEAWLYPAKLYFLNMSPAPAESWQPQDPLLTRDPERGLLQLTLAAEYTAQVDNAALFMQMIVLKRGLYDWPAVHHYVRERLNERVTMLLAHNRTSADRLSKMQEKTAQLLLRQLNLDLRGNGLIIPNMSITGLAVHPQMYQLWQAQKDYLVYNRAVSRTIVG